MTSSMGQVLARKLEASEVQSRESAEALQVREREREREAPGDRSIAWLVGKPWQWCLAQAVTCLHHDWDMPWLGWAMAWLGHGMAGPWHGWDVAWLGRGV